MPTNSKTLNLGQLKQEPKNTLNLESLKIEQENQKVIEKAEFLERKNNQTRKFHRNSAFKEKSFRNNFTFFRKKSFLTLVFFTLMVLIGLSGLKYWYSDSEDFYLGKWQAELSENEKNGGIKSFNYEFSPSELLQEIELESQGIKSKVNFRSEFKVNTANKTKISLERSKYEITNMNIEVPPILCNSNTDCENIRKTFEEKFKEEFNRNLNSNMTISITKISGNKIKFESNQEGDIILVKK